MSVQTGIMTTQIGRAEFSAIGARTMGELTQLTQSQENWLRQIKTTYRRELFRRVMLNARPENQGLVIPEGVEWYRNLNFIEQQVAEHDTAIKKMRNALIRNANQLSKLLG